MKSTLSLMVLLAAVMLTGCATGYGPKGMSNWGYEEQQIDESSYRVSFHGNSNTPSDKVWNYWMYRCAELTKIKGFEFFSIIIEKKKTGALPGDNGLRPVNLRDGEEGRLSKAAYYYRPGSTYTVTTYHSSAIIKMYRNPLPSDVKFALNAQSVLDSLKPYVESSGKEAAPKREEIIGKATVKGAS